MIAPMPWLGKLLICRTSLDMAILDPAMTHYVLWVNAVVGITGRLESATAPISSVMRYQNPRRHSESGELFCTPWGRQQFPAF